MKILVLGAGGVGGYFGGRLAQAGADVSFLVRAKRAAQLAANGLVIKAPTGDLKQAVTTVLAQDVKPVYDFVLFTCKAYDLDDAMASIAPAMGGTAAVLPLLNGMRHLDRLDQKFGRAQVLGGAAQIIATLNPAGEIVQMNDIHTLIFGERSSPTSKRSEELAAIMGNANFVSKLSPDIQLEMWEKFVFLATLAGMTCLMRAGIGLIVRSDDGEALMLEMLEECRKVATAEGSEPRAEMLQRARGMLTDRKQAFTASMMRDIEKGGPIEGEHIVGDMLLRARKHGIAAPLLRVATSHLQTYEILRNQA